MIAFLRQKYDVPGFRAMLYLPIRDLNSRNATTSQRYPRPHPAQLGLRSLRPGRRVRQPQDQPHGAVPQPGDPRTGTVLPAHVPPLLGHPHDSAEHLGPHHGVGFPHARSVRSRADGARLRHRRHLVDHRQRRKGPGNVPHRAPGFAGIDHRDRRTCGGDSGYRRNDRCRPHRARRRHRPGCAGSWARTSTAPIRHPEIVSGFDARTLGIKLPQTKGNTAATIIPSVGCPMGCNFCTTSAFFGGKGKYLNFYETGDELFSVMSQMEHRLEREVVLHDGRELPAA